MAKTLHYDIAIIGAGPAGLCFARTLADTGLQIAIIEKLDEKSLANPKNDGRDIALTHISEKLMRDMGMWQHIPEDQIGKVCAAQVVNCHSPYTLHLDAQDTDKDYLSHVVPNYIIRKVAYKSIKGIDNINLLTGVEVTGLSTTATSGTLKLSDGTEISTRLIVAADSRFSNTRRKMGISASMKDFGWMAIAAKIKHELPHNNITHGSYQKDRLFTVAPFYGNTSTVTTILPSNIARSLLAMSDDEFVEDLRQNFGDILGKMELIGERHSYPMVGVWANRFVATRFALIGDAAVGMHPITAHGFNLGLHGTEALAHEIRKAVENNSDIGSNRTLLRYQAIHRRKGFKVYNGTNAFVKLYTDVSPPGLILRKAALRLGNNFSPIKNHVLGLLTDDHF